MGSKVADWFRWSSWKLLWMWQSYFVFYKRGGIHEKQRKWEFLKRVCKWMSLYKLAAFLPHNWRIKNLYLGLEICYQDLQLNRWTYTLHRRVSKCSWSIRVEYQMVIEHKCKLYEKTKFNVRNLASHSTNNVTPTGVAAHILSMPV